MAEFAESSPAGGTRRRSFDETAAPRFQMLSRRAQTFVGEEAPLQVQDVLFRRHFGQADGQFKPLHRGMRSTSYMSTNTVREEAVIVVDTFSTGAMLSDILYKRGFKVVRVLSGDLGDLEKMVPAGVTLTFEATFVYDVTLEHDDAISNILDGVALLGYPVRAVMAGAETGVELADTLSERLGVRTNGTKGSDARRNKYAMGETIRAAGVRAVKQLRANKWADIAAFLEAWQPSPFKVVVKPCDSAGSDDVTLCHSPEQVQRAYGNIMGKTNGLGLVNEGVLVQEFLEGLEYVVDSVSRDGQHNIAALWVYDRRPANGADFVAHGQFLLHADDERCHEIVAYTKTVLDALGILNGPAHAEVKWHQGQPVLVEVGSRCHGGDGLWLDLEDECWGYNQATCAVDAYTDEEAYRKMPSAPRMRHAYGAAKWLVSSAPAGVFRGVDPSSIQEIEALSSYRSHQIFVEVGGPINPTINCFTWGGAVILANKSEEQLMADYKRVEELEKTTLFRVEHAADAGGDDTAAAAAAVAVVDPFGAVGFEVAARLAATHRVVAVYSAKLDQLKAAEEVVPAGVKLSFDAALLYRADTAAVLKAMNVVAVVAGATTGTTLASALANELGVGELSTTLSSTK